MSMRRPEDPTEPPQWWKELTAGDPKDLASFRAGETGTMFQTLRWIVSRFNEGKFWYINPGIVAEMARRLLLVHDRLKLLEAIVGSLHRCSAWTSDGHCKEMATYEDPGDNTMRYACDRHHMDWPAIRITNHVEELPWADAVRALEKKGVK